MSYISYDLQHHFFFTKITTTVSYNVKLSNGQEVPITHISIIKLSKLITLENVLCVLSFAFNLIIAPTLAKNVSYCFVFLFNVCFLQDLMSWTTIGLSAIKNSLYHLQNIEVSPTTLMCKLSKYFDTYHLSSACVTNTSHVSNL